VDIISGFCSLSNNFSITVIKSRKNQFVVCPTCGGLGKNKLGLVCPACSGMGVGIFYNGQFFYWGPKLGRAVIELDHLRKKIHKIIDFVSFFIALVGLLSLSAWVYFTSTTAEDIGVFAFWREKSILILAFWISMIAYMFIIYRMTEERRKQHRIEKVKYEDRMMNKKLPNNWEELLRARSKYKINVAGGFSPAAMEVVEQAYLLASSLNHSFLTPMHLFFASLSDPEVAALFSRLNTDNKKLVEFLKNRIPQVPSSKERTELSPEIKEVLIEAYIQASEVGQDKVVPINFIVPAMNYDKVLYEILYDLEVETQKVYNVILWFVVNRKQIEAYRTYRKLARFKPSGNMDRAYTSVATPILNQVAYDLTVAAKWGKLEYCVAREEEIEKIWQVFESGGTSVVLVGPDGVGKGTVIDGIAQLMVKEDVPKFLQDKRLVEIDAARLISGAIPSEAQGRMMAVIDEVIRAGNIVIYINNIEKLMGISSGGEGSLDLASVLAGALERKQIYALASASSENYVKYVERESLGSIMSKIDVLEPEGDKAVQIVESKISSFEGKYRIYFSYKAIERAIALSKQYIHDKYLPEKAIKILEMVAVAVSKEKGEQSIVSEEDVAASVSKMTGIPVTKIGVNEGEKLLNLEKEIHKRMIAQSEAVKMVSASLRRARAMLREGKRPIANFLFLGPTGVGKTELAKSVSEVYFGDENYMIRVDMSEYQHPDSVKKMIGDASGAKGYLTEMVRKTPFSLILLDELEKAHPDILNLFLQVMDDGRLTDGQGRTIDFTNTILIATSNAGAMFIQKEVLAGTPIAEIKDALINEHLIQVMRPEFINRFDGVIVFEPLSLENVVEITRLMLKSIAKMLENKGINFRAEEEGVRILAKQGFDPKFGARPLRRLLQDKVEDAIANKLLSGELQRRDTFVIDADANANIEKRMKL